MNGESVDGLTLVEVLVSLAIFTVLSVAVLGSLPGILKVNRQTRDDQAVTVPAKAYMENVRAYFNDPTVTVDTTTGKSTTAGQTNFDKQPPLAVAVPDSTKTNGYTCTSQSNNLITTSVEYGSVTTLKRVTLTCTLSGKPTQTFTVDFARPL